ADEVSCTDGLDNDCDGFPEVRRSRKLEVVVEAARLHRSSVDTQVVRFGGGHLAVWVDEQFSFQSNDAVLYRLTDAALQPHPRSGALDFVSNAVVLRPAPDGMTYAVTSSLSNLQVLPFTGGALVLWEGYDAATDARFRRVARLEVGPSPAEAVVGMAKRELPASVAAAPLHAAVSRDGQSLLLAWSAEGVLLGQAFGPDLSPRSEPKPLSVPLADEPPSPRLARAAVAAAGASDFAVGWSLVPAQPGAPSLLRFRRVSATLEPLGEVVAAQGQGPLADLRLLPGEAEDAAPLAVWLEAPGTSAGGMSAAGAGLVVAQPFVSGAAALAPVPLPTTGARLQLARDGDGILLVHPGEVPASGEAPGLVLRRIAADGSSAVRQLGAVPASSFAPVSILPDVEPGFVSVIYTADERAQLSAACRL
ncbi:MAG TPA: hypothetical protein VFO83_12325, partial [Aggregicoccus sp.]|nr:hypothetical protein [Aggregicoccus sp.]